MVRSTVRLVLPADDALPFNLAFLRARLARVRRRTQEFQELPRINGRRAYQFVLESATNRGLAYSITRRRNGYRVIFGDEVEFNEVNPDRQMLTASIRVWCYHAPNPLSRPEAQEELKHEVLTHDRNWREEPPLQLPMVMNIGGGAHNIRNIGDWRLHIFSFQVEEANLQEKIDRIQNLLLQHPYIIRTHILDDAVVIRREPVILPPRRRRMRNFIAARAGVLTVEEPTGTCVIDVIEELFKGRKYGTCKKYPKTVDRANIVEWFATRGPIEEGYTIDDVLDWCKEHNAGWCIAKDAFGQTILSWTHTDAAHNNTRQGIIMQIVDDHVYYAEYTRGRGKRTKDVDIMPDITYDRKKFETVERLQPAHLAEISGQALYVADEHGVHRGYLQEVRSGFIPRILSINPKIGAITEWVSRSGRVVKAVGRPEVGKALSKLCEKEYEGQGVNGLTLDLFEKCGLKTSTLSPDAVELFSDIDSYIHQYLYEKHETLGPKCDYAADISAAFIGACYKGLPRFSIHDEPQERNDDPIHPHGFYFCTDPRAEMFPLFGSNRWYVGALLQRLIDDNEIAADSLTHQITPREVVPGSVAEKWWAAMWDVMDEPNDFSRHDLRKKLTVAAIGSMKARAYKQYCGRSQVFHYLAEALHYKNEYGGRLLHIPLLDENPPTVSGMSEPQEFDAAAHITDEDDPSKYVWLVQITGEERVQVQSHLPAWKYISQMCALRTYEIARELIIQPDWRGAIGGVCVDGIAFRKGTTNAELIAAGVARSNKPKFTRTPGDYVVESTFIKITHVFDQSKREKREPYTKPEREPELIDFTLDALWDASRCCVVARGGRGKSWMARQLYSRAMAEGKTCIIAAPMAAALESIILEDTDKVLNEDHLCTVHHLLGMDAHNNHTGRGSWTRELDVLVLDEYYLNNVLQQIEIYKLARRFPTCRIYLMGDPKQNKPVDGSGTISPDSAFVFDIVDGVYSKPTKNYRLDSSDPSVKQLAKIVDDLYDTWTMPDLSAFATAPPDCAKWGLSICPFNRQVDHINEKKALANPAEKTTLPGLSWPVFVGQKLIATYNRLYYHNGQRFRVITVKAGSVVAVNSRGKSIEISATSLSNDFQQAYAMTGHKVQGATIREPYTIVSPVSAVASFGLEWLYVALSRATRMSDISIADLYVPQLKKKTDK